MTDSILNLRCRVITPEEAVEYFKSLVEEEWGIAKEYVEKAPKQIDTPVRKALVKLFANR